MILKTFENLQVPSLGFGTWQLQGTACHRAVQHAIDIGYRHIDTAQLYENEQEIGRAISETGINREELFITTKVKQDQLSCEKVLHSTEESLNKLQTDYCDLLLVHWPSENVPLENTLEAMKVLKADGKIRAIGVSNFPPALTMKALEIANIMCNQVEYHPYIDQQTLLQLAEIHYMMITAYSPLSKGKVLKDPTLNEIASIYGKSASQIALRWLIQQQNVVAIPKASDPQHRVSNFDIFDFELSEKDMERISLISRKGMPEKTIANV